MSEKEEYVEVKVRVPKRFMRLIEGEHYFGRSKEEFWLDVVRAGVSSQLFGLSYEEDLKRKYGIENEDLLTNFLEDTPSFLEQALKREKHE